MTDPTPLLADSGGALRSGPTEAPATPRPGSPRPLVVLGPPGPAPSTRGEGREGVLGELDRRLLLRLGGTPLHPPLLPDGFAASEHLATLRAEGRALARRLGEAAVLEDAALCLLLPFWRLVLGVDPVVVLVVPEPAEAAHAAARGGVSLVHALALYEHYLRAGVEAARGLPVYVAPTGAAPDGALAAFLAAAAHRGTPPGLLWPGPPAFGEAGEGPHVLPEIAELHRRLLECAGPHDAFEPPALAAPSAWGEELLRRGREVVLVGRALEWTARKLEPLVRHEPAPPLPAEAGDGGAGPGGTEEPAAGRPLLDASEDRRRYHQWLGERRQPVLLGRVGDPVPRRAATRPGGGRPLLSILLPLYKTPIGLLERCVASVLAQDDASWQLCVCDDGSKDPELSAYLRGLRRVDRRIALAALADNGGISAATNGALRLARGAYVTFLDHDDELAHHAVSAVRTALAAHPGADMLYSDEDKVDLVGERFDPLFKPEWSPDLLLSFAYTCHLTVLSRPLIDELGGLRSEFDGSQDYDLALRASERAREIVHIPDVLYHWRAVAGSAASDGSGALAKPWAYAAGHRAIEDALSRRGEPGEVLDDPRFPGRYHVRRAVTGAHRVSAVIPFRDEPSLLATCARSLLAHAGHDDVELLLVDNGSELPETETLLERLATWPQVRVLRHPGPFNWAKINNTAARRATGDVLLFVNNDIEARRHGWCSAMLGHALRPEVGAVGARLLYPDGAIQHAGVAIGLGGIAGHVLRGLPGERPGYCSMAIATRDCSVVTGAAMMTRAEVFSDLGGFDEELPVAFNDVDYCLKIREAGRLVVYTPLAELVHHESRSRGHTDDLDEHKRIVDRWAPVIAAGDPYMNVHLSHWRHWCPLSTPQEDYRWKMYLETSVLAPGSSGRS